MSDCDTQRPLAGFRVLDLSNVLAGPFCCHQLAHLGAEVIKVEAPGSGDLARRLGADPKLNQNGMGISFLAQNAGKQSITLNLKSPRGKALLKELVRGADVLVENFRPGVMERLELGYEALKVENPRLVYCAISGFGQDGPMRALPAYDQIIQGLSGAMSVTGAVDTAPYRVGYPIADTIGGITAAFAIAAALAGRAGESEAAGCFLDVSMLESVIATMGWVVSNYLIAGLRPRPLGNENFTASPSGTFRTEDGLLNIAANKQEQFEALCRVVACPELVDDPRYTDRQARLEHRAELKRQIEEALATRPAVDWVGRLNAAGVPAGAVLDVPQALAQAQIRERGMIACFEGAPGVDQDIRVVRTGIKIDGRPPRVVDPPPRLGEHTDAVLTGLGYGAEAIERLHGEGVI